MKTFFATISFLVLLFFVSSSQTLAQETANSNTGQSNEQVLKEILTELKTLRSVLAKTSVNQIRFQTTFEQYKVQQSRVDSMIREMDSIKIQLTANPFRSNSEDMIKTTEERLAQTTDPRQQQMLERQLQSIKRNLDVQDQREKRLKERQMTLEAQTPVEQAKLEQLNSDIDRIKQDMDSVLSQ